MSKNYYSLGLMSGTSGDGVDASLINSDGDLNYKVENQQRVRIMNIHLKSPLGTYRDLTKEELNTLKTNLKNRSKSCAWGPTVFSFFLCSFPLI